MTGLLRSVEFRLQLFAQPRASLIPPSGQNVISTSLLPYVILDVFFCKCFALLFNTNIGGMCFPKIVLKLGYIQLGVAISLPIGRLPSKVGTPSQS